jgi:hypothetical protein
MTTRQIAIMAIFAAQIPAAAAAAAAQEMSSSLQQPPPTVAAGTCLGLDSMKFTVSRTTEGTASQAYVDVVDGGNIAINSTAQGCVVVTFSGDMQVSNSGNSLVARIVLDGVSCAPSDVVLMSHAGFDSRAMTFVCSNVPAGDHAIQVKYRSYKAGQSVAVATRTLTVSYR